MKCEDHKSLEIIDLLNVLLFVGPASASSCKISVVGNNWLVGGLVANVVFSETALTIFLIFA